MTRVAASPTEIAVACGGMVLVAGVAFFVFFGQAIAGGLGESPLGLALIAVAVASVGFGFLGAPRWWLVALSGSIPSGLLGALMSVGMLEGGHLDQAYFLAVPAGTVLSVFALCWLGARFRRFLFDCDRKR